MIKAVIFDMGGVFIQHGSAEERDLLSAQLGLSPGELHHRLYGGEEWALARAGTITDDEFWQRVGPHIGLASPMQIHAFAQAYFSRLKERLETRFVELAQRLRGHYQVALLSNATDRLERFLEDELSIAGLFDLVVNSARVGLAKPDPAIYELALERLGVAPQEAIFVDDRVNNVISAARLGIHAVHHVTFERTAAQIRALLDKHSPKIMIDVPIPEDYARMLAISRAVSEEDWWGATLMLAQPETPTDIAVLCDDPENIILVARVGGQIAGLGLLIQPSPAVLRHTAELSVAVHPDHRRRGVARRIIETLLPAAARRGVALVRAWVASANGAARALIEGLGFQKMASIKDELRRPDGRRFDVIVYSQEVSPDSSGAVEPS